MAPPEFNLFLEGTAYYVATCYEREGGGEREREREREELERVQLGI